MSSLTFKKLSCTKLSNDFRAATEKVDATFTEKHLKPNTVLIRNLWVGINASDVNWTAGKYIPGIQPPFDCGFESLSVVVAVGSAVTSLRPGNYVLSAASGGFAEYQILKPGLLTQVPTSDVSYLPLRVNGLTAYVALEKYAHPLPGEVALVTAAAGGTGQFAVQLLKHHYKCHVIGTCSGDTKAAFLKSIGCDRVIDYKKERLGAVLRKEYKKGVNVVFESVGGSMFEDALKNIAVHGRLLTIGAVEGYTSVGAKAAAEARNKRQGAPNWLNMVLISRSASIMGFLLTQMTGKETGKYLSQLMSLYANGVFKSGVDGKQFAGLDEVANAVEYLHSGKSFGKVVVRLSSDNTPLDSMTSSSISNAGVLKSKSKL